jgi:transcriptional regulator of acetoin/glycerol metabolism
MVNGKPMQSQKKNTLITFVASHQELVEIMIKLVQETGLTVNEIIHLGNDAQKRKKLQNFLMNWSTITQLKKNYPELDSMLHLLSTDTLYLIIASGEFAAPLYLTDGYKTLNEVEKEYIVKTLQKCNGCRRSASKLLGIDRTTLYRKLKTYGITKKSVR